MVCLKNPGRIGVFSQKRPKMTQIDKKLEKTLILPGFFKQTIGFWWLFYA